MLCRPDGQVMIKIIAVFALGIKLLHFRCGWLKAAQSVVSDAATLIGPKGTVGLFYQRRSVVLPVLILFVGENS